MLLDRLHLPRNKRRPSMTRGHAEFSQVEDTEPVDTSGWRVILLCGLYTLLGAIAAAVAALVGTFPHWI
jgi:hypothetical protein